MNEFNNASDKKMTDHRVYYYNKGNDEKGDTKERLKNLYMTENEIICDEAGSYDHLDDIISRAKKHDVLVISSLPDLGDDFMDMSRRIEALNERGVLLITAELPQSVKAGEDVDSDALKETTEITYGIYRQFAKYEKERDE